MRKWFWIFLGVVGMASIAAITLTPLRYVLYPEALTPKQQAILRGANTGLAVWSTKSPTASRYHREALQSGRWSRFITVKPAPILRGEPGKAFSITVMSGDAIGTIAFYLHATKSICFVEATCDSLGYLPLGLVYVHELGHRDDYIRGLVKISDLPNSLPFRETEARARLLEIRVLQEFSSGRLAQAVDQHIRAYQRLPARQRRGTRVTHQILPVDFQWVRQEFGNLTRPDQENLARIILMTAGIKQLLRGRPSTAADSLEAVMNILGPQ